MLGCDKIGAQVALPRQLIPPRALHEFTFKVGYDKADIQYSRLELIAFDEKHKRHSRFALYRYVFEINNKSEPVPDGKQVRIMLLCSVWTKKMQQISSSLRQAFLIIYTESTYGYGPSGPRHKYATNPEG